MIRSKGSSHDSKPLKTDRKHQFITTCLNAVDVLSFLVAPLSAKGRFIGIIGILSKFTQSTEQIVIHEYKDKTETNQVAVIYNFFAK